MHKHALNALYTYCTISTEYSTYVTEVCLLSVDSAFSRSDASEHSLIIITVAMLRKRRREDYKSSQLAINSPLQIKRQRALIKHRTCKQFKSALWYVLYLVP